MISDQKQSRSFATLLINAGRYDYLAGISVLCAMKELTSRATTDKLCYLQKITSSETAEQLVRFLGLTIVNGLVRRALLRTSYLGLTFRKVSGAQYFEEIFIGLQSNKTRAELDSLTV